MARRLRQRGRRYGRNSPRLIPSRRLLRAVAASLRRCRQSLPPLRFRSRARLRRILHSPASAPPRWHAIPVAPSHAAPPGYLVDTAQFDRLYSFGEDIDSTLFSALAQRHKPSAPPLCLPQLHGLHFPCVPPLLQLCSSRQAPRMTQDILEAEQTVITTGNDEPASIGPLRLNTMAASPTWTRRSVKSSTG